MYVCVLISSRLQTASIVAPPARSVSACRSFAMIWLSVCRFRFILSPPTPEGPSDSHCTWLSFRGAGHGYRAAMMEDSHPEDVPPDRWSRREASNPDLLIGLVGQYYGTVPRKSTVSITEQEYDTAKVAGIDRLMFLTKKGARKAIDG